jgi:hypothetical protein
MVTFFDGPAKGAELTLRRTPVFLRAVISAAGKVDALDMPEDDPAPFEDIYAYRIVDGTKISGFICGNKELGCIHFNSAVYRLCKTQPEESILQSRKLWMKWVEEVAKGGNRERD